MKLRLLPTEMTTAKAHPEPSGRNFCLLRGKLDLHIKSFQDGPVSRNCLFAFLSVFEFLPKFLLG